jgi:methionine-rich copper-binding protein CopC
MKIHHSFVPIVLLAILLLGVPPAHAHASVVRVSPAANGSLQTAPRDVSILFSERVQAAADAIVVQDASGARVDQGDARSESNGRVVRASLKPLSVGTYKVMWRIKSSDGHTAEGSYSFRVRQ